MVLVNLPPVGAEMNTAVLLLSTPMDVARKGVLANISQILIAHNGSVLDSEHHVDSGSSKTKLFLLCRVQQ
jgi:hypothetical protein